MRPPVTPRRGNSALNCRSAPVSTRYASLYFVCCVDGADSRKDRDGRVATSADNELLCLEVIHTFVEVLDKYFGSVCELGASAPLPSAPLPSAPLPSRPSPAPALCPTPCRSDFPLQLRCVVATRVACVVCS